MNWEIRIFLFIRSKYNSHRNIRLAEFWVLQQFRFILLQFWGQKFSGPLRRRSDFPTPCVLAFYLNFHLFIFVLSESQWENKEWERSSSFPQCPQNQEQNGRGARDPLCCLPVQVAAGCWLPAEPGLEPGTPMQDEWAHGVLLAAPNTQPAPGLLPVPSAASFPLLEFTITLKIRSL